MVLGPKATDREAGTGPEAYSYSPRGQHRPQGLKPQSAKPAPAQGLKKTAEMLEPVQGLGATAPAREASTGPGA